MQGMIEQILSSFANECSVETADGVKTVRAFIEPVKNRSKSGFLHHMHALGELPEGRYVYIGPVSVLPAENGSVFAGDREFSVCRAETVLLQDAPLYVLGLLRECGGFADAEAN